MAGYAQMMQQMKKMQREMDKKQQEIDTREFVGEAGSGLVKVTALGTKEVTSIAIDDTLLTDDKEMLEDLLRVAVNAVMTEIETTTENEVNKLTGGMSMPGLF